MRYEITTDSTVDLSLARLKEIGVQFVSYPYNYDGKEYMDDLGDESTDRVYSALNDGKDIKTGQGPLNGFLKIWEPILLEGRDILHLCFSSALSGTINSASAARLELLEKYPGRNIFLLDTLSGSAGLGLLVEYAVYLKNSRIPFFEVCESVENRRLRIQHWFTVDDLTCLRKSGRVSNAVMFIATLLNIKPILHVDDEGRITLFENVRGRSSSLRRLVDRMTEKLDDTLDSMAKTVTISHANCQSDALKLKEMILKKFPQLTVVVYRAGAIISAHVGQGTIGLFFTGKSNTRMV